MMTGGHATGTEGGLAMAATTGGAATTAGAGVRHTQGAPCWVSLMTTDLDAAQDFYARLFSWDYTPGPLRLGPYARATVDGRPVAGIGVVDARLGFPVDWVTYFAADSADEVAGRIRDCGGTVALGPLDSDAAGRLVVASDPDGAVFGVWEGHAHLGWAVRDEPGTAAWSELATLDVARAVEFYTGVFGSTEVHRFDGAGERTLLAGADGIAVAGVHRAGPDEAPAWRVHFAVSDLAEAERTARGLGARSDVPSCAGSLSLRDPHGGPFALVQLQRS
jgi:predicted enzyme related to lactoylglutathione lyase